VHHGHPVDDAQRDVEVVLDEDVAHVRRQRAQQRHQLPALGRREPGRRFVEEDQARRSGQRHADLELPLLAVRQIGDPGGGDAGEPGSLEQLVGGALRGAGRSRMAHREAAARDTAHGEEEVLAHRQVAEQERGLVRAAQALADALVGRELGDVLAEETDPAGGRRKVAGDGVEERRLAGAVRAEHGVLLAGLHGKGDVVDRAKRAEGARHVVENEGVVGGQRRRGVAARRHAGSARAACMPRTQLRDGRHRRSL
jgi:hypothetical protein